MKKPLSNKSFSFFLALSLLFHFTVILMLIVSKSLPNLFTKNNSLVIQNSIQIDSIGLPDLPSKPKAKRKKIKAVSIQKEKKQPALQKQNQKKKKEKVTKKSEQKKKAEKSTDSKNNNPAKSDNLNKGNKLSKGSKEGNPDLTAQELSEISLYANQIDNQIRAQWRLPKYLTDTNLTAQVEIKINKLGRLIYKQVLISSGNELFDSFVLKAIDNAEPYPAPSPDIQSFIKDGIVLTLHSRN